MYALDCRSNELVKIILTSLKSFSLLTKLWIFLKHLFFIVKSVKSLRKYCIAIIENPFIHSLF